MTLSQIEEALKLAGYQRSWAATEYVPIPFRGSTPVMTVRYGKPSDTSHFMELNSSFTLWFPHDGRIYDTRELRFLHKETMARLKDRGIDISPEVLSVMRHCS